MGSERTKDRGSDGAGKRKSEEIESAGEGDAGERGERMSKWCTRAGGRAMESETGEV